MGICKATHPHLPAATTHKTNEVREHLQIHSCMLRDTECSSDLHHCFTFGAVSLSSFWWCRIDCSSLRNMLANNCFIILGEQLCATPLKLADCIEVIQAVSLKKTNDEGEVKRVLAGECFHLPLRFSLSVSLCLANDLSCLFLVGNEANPCRRTKTKTKMSTGFVFGNVHPRRAYRKTKTRTKNVKVI